MKREEKGGREGVCACGVGKEGGRGNLTQLYTYMYIHMTFCKLSIIHVPWYFVNNGGKYLVHSSAMLS